MPLDVFLTQTAVMVPEAMTVWPRLITCAYAMDRDEMPVMRTCTSHSSSKKSGDLKSMDSATRNAKEMVDRLTLYMNKVRQAAITREIIEVVSGAQAT